MHALTEEDIQFAIFDENPVDQPAIRAALLDAQSKQLYEFGLLTNRFYITYQNFQMQASINRTGFAASRENITRILGKMGCTLPKIVYEVAAFAPGNPPA